MSFDIPGGFISVTSPVYPPTAMPSLPPQEVFRSSTPRAEPMMLHAHTYPMAHEHRMPQHLQHSCSFPQCEAEYGERDIRPVTPGTHKNSHEGPYVYSQSHDSEKTLAPSNIEELYYNEPITEQNRNSPSFENYTPTTPPLLLYAQLAGQHQAKTHGFHAGMRRGLEKVHIHVHKKSIGEALAHNAGLATAIPVPVGVVGSTPSLDTSYSQPRSSPNVTSSALKPNYKKRFLNLQNARIRTIAGCGTAGSLLRGYRV
ncbi:hypothetical protein PENSPDRAFT_58718 [Peniophora sp. CONT]|nr:hypothetical protein PENSPDRAFT_58718 [Peniophora sp. CONT]